MNVAFKTGQAEAVHSVPNAADFVGRDHDDARVKRRRPELLMFTSRLQILLYVSFFFYIGTLRLLKVCWRRPTFPFYLIRSFSLPLRSTESPDLWIAFANTICKCGWLLHFKNVFAGDFIEVANKVRLGQNRLVIKNYICNFYIITFCYCKNLFRELVTSVNLRQGLSLFYISFFLSLFQTKEASNIGHV